MVNYIALKNGKIIEYHFTKKFINNNQKICNRLYDVWNEIYKEPITSLWKKSTDYSQNKQLHIKIYSILKEMFDLGITIKNSSTNKKYEDINEIKKDVIKIE